MDHLPIRVNTLRGDQKIDFDVYLKINDKVILYLHAGDSFEGARLQKLKAKKLKKMFIRPEDEAAYRQYVASNLESAYDDKSGKDITTRAEIVSGEQQSRVEEVFENPELQANYDAAKDGAEKYVKFLMNNTGSIQSVMSIENTDQSISHHGVNVATMAVALAQKLKIADAKITQLMTLGSLLHDIGHQDSGINLVRPLKAFSPGELELYKKHPEVGGLRVQDKKHFDQMVINIIAQHEECANGTGYPKGLLDRQMDPIVMIVATCNAIDRMMTFEGVPRQTVAKKAMLEKVGEYPLGHIQALVELLKK